MHFQLSLVLLSFVSLGMSVLYTPFMPPSYPLAVKNPYLSAWIPGEIGDLATTRAQFWTGAQLNWAVIARVNGVSYNLFGVADPLAGSSNAAVMSASYTSTHTTFVVAAAEFNFTLDFLSPINPKDYVRQSLPFSYLTVSASPLQPGLGANVQIYSDFDDSWNGQNLELFDQTSTWNTTNVEGTVVWQISNLNGTEYVETGPNLDMASWGSTIYATKASTTSKLSSAAGLLSNIRSTFVSQGRLASKSDDKSDDVQVPSWKPRSVMGFSHDLGLVSESSQVTFAIGYYRDCEFEYLGDCRIGYFRSEYNDPVSAAVFFLNDYENAQAQSLTMDSKISDLAIRSAGQNMADITALSARQTFGAIDLTISKATYDTDDHMVFMKEISSDGNVNTIDVIFPAFPQFYVLDVEYIRLLLEPVMQYLASGRWTPEYVIHDLGNYPRGNGHDDGIDELMPIEETGNLLILANVYQTASGNKAWAAKYSDLFESYADYLVSNGLYPAWQLSSDDSDGASTNQTNLAIKAAIGLTAYGAMSGNDSYTKIGQSFGHQIYDEGLGMNADKTHFTFNYGLDGWAMSYNVFPDYMLKLNTFNPEMYETLSNFYPTVRGESGVPLLDQVVYGKTDWMLWVAMTCDIQTRDMFVSDVHDLISNGKSSAPFPDRYDVEGNTAGNAGAFRARPVVGGEWAGLAILESNIA